MNISFRIGAESVLGPLLVVAGCVLLARARRGEPAWTGHHAVLRLMTALYGAAVLSITVFPLDITWGEYANQSPWYNQINFIPLITVDVTAVPNVVMMVPLGFLLPLLSARASSGRRVTLMTAAAGLSIEAAQLLSYLLFNNGRAVDINDLLVNTLGGLAGWLALRAALRPAGPRSRLVAMALPGSAVGSRAVGRERGKERVSGGGVSAATGGGLPRTPDDGTSGAG